MIKVNRRWLLRASLAAGAAPFAMPALAQDRAAIIEGARKEGQLALATSASQASFVKYLDAFKAKYPFLDVATGLYAAPTGRVLARVEAELRSGNVTVDVLHVANQAPYLEMARKGQLLHYPSAEYAAYPAGAHDGGHWATARAIGVIMAYNRNVLAADKAPRAWTDLLRPEFKGKKIIIQNAAAGTQFAQIYMLEKTLGLDFLKNLAAQEPVIVATTGQLIDSLVRGEALVGGTVDHWRAFEPEAMKAGIVPVYPTEGMPVAVAPIAIFKNAPHPNAARLFIDFVLSAEGQTLLNTELFGVYSMRNGLAPPPNQRSLAEAKPLLPTDLADYEKAAANFPNHFDSLFK
jgi:iron(III) transport system substrate-binding protein